MAASGLHISIAAEPLFNIGGLPITNSILTSLVVSALLITFGIFAHMSLKQTSRPTGLQNFAEWIVESLYNLVHSITNNTKKTKQFLPFVATFFLFILLNNWLGLLPGVGTIGIMENEQETHAALSTQTVSVPVKQAYATTAGHEEAVAPTNKEVNEAVTEEHVDAASQENTSEEHAVSEKEATHPTFVPLFRAGTADLNTTLALALITVFLIQYFGIKSLGLSYFKKYVNFSNPIMFFVGILETISEISKIISFAFRLFGNVFAGEVLLVVTSALVPLVAPVPFYGLEVFVGFIQALVFAMLSLVLYNLATISHDEH